MTRRVSTHGRVIRDYLLAHDGKVLAAAALNAASVFFIWFLGSLREVLRSAEGEGASLSLVTFGAGIATIVLATIAILPAAVLSWNHTANWPTTGFRASVVEPAIAHAGIYCKTAAIFSYFDLK